VRRPAAKSTWATVTYLHAHLWATASVDQGLDGQGRIVRRKFRDFYVTAVWSSFVTN